MSEIYIEKQKLLGKKSWLGMGWDKGVQAKQDWQNVGYCYEYMND